MSSTNFGVLRDGREIDMLSMQNTQGIRVKIITYGAIVTSLEIPDRAGRFADVVLGHENIESYETRSPYFGAVVGRYANRIAHGAFSLDGARYQVSLNERASALHGGMHGFDKAVWKVEETTDQVVRLAHTSPAGDQGFPGELEVTVIYALTDASELTIEYEAVTTASTVLNLTQHTYWNLAGAGNGNILDHELTLGASNFTPVDADLIPTGEIRSVSDTPFDFRIARRLGARITEDTEQLHIGSGYDHNFVLDGMSADRLFDARLREPQSGRQLEVFTTEPGIQLYSGNHLDNTIAGKEGRLYPRYAGLCLETQHFPDSPNQPDFPSTVLKPGDRFKSRTLFRFGAD